MKNLKATIVMCLITMVSYGQVKYSVYYDSYSNKSYDVSISDKNNNKYTLYVDMNSVDNVSKVGGIMLSESQHKLFIDKLNEVKTKYNEWNIVAKSNNVTDLSKEINLKVNTGACFKFGSKWHFQSDIVLSFEYRIINEKNLLIVRTGKIVSSSNDYIRHDGFAFVFKDSNEIDEFINILSVDKVLEYLSKPKADDLFE